MAIALSAVMAVKSQTATQVHHDEYDHVNAARFYYAHWLPPAVGDAQALPSYSIFGMSYLNEWDVVYLFAAKFALLIRPVVHDDTIALRLFNVGLFAILGCIAFFRRDQILSLAIVLTSPQIWYVFGYFNGDAFPMFLSVLAGYLLTSPRSLFNDRTRSALIRYLPLGICVGLLVLSKRTFWAFALFACGYAAWSELSAHAQRCTPTLFLQRMGTFAAIIAITALPRIALDLYLNGTPAQKSQRITQTAESLAAPIFKPSSRSKASLNLRGKGIGIVDMMKPPLSWAWYSFATAFGTYNYNAIWSKPFYYPTILGIYALFLLYLCYAVSRYGSLDERFVLAGSVLCSLLVVGLSVYHSWMNDFQPQGRYLFAIFAIVGVLLARNRRLLTPGIVNLFLVSCFALSLYSFIGTGLGKLWDYRDLVKISDEFRRP